MKRLLAALTLSLFILFGWAAIAQEPDEGVAETEVTAPAVPGAVDYRSAGALLAAAVGGAGLTWASKKFGAVKKGNPMKMYLTSGVFTVLAGVGAGVGSGLSWKDSLIMSGMGWLSQQGVYKAAKHRPAS
jgi:hypothetical protein